MHSSVDFKQLSNPSLHSLMSGEFCSQESFLCGKSIPLQSPVFLFLLKPLGQGALDRFGTEEVVVVVEGDDVVVVLNRVVDLGVVVVVEDTRIVLPKHKKDPSVLMHLS